jgi:signal transduction histidine kinase
MRRSISLKITFVLVLISLIGAVIAGLYVEYNTRKAFESFVQDQDQSVLVNALIEHYQERESWQGVNRVFMETQLLSSRAANQRSSGNQPQGRENNPPFLITNPAGLIMAGGTNPAGLVPGDRINPAEYEKGTELTLEGETIGWLVPIHFSNPRNNPNQGFINTVRQALLVSALITLAVALTLGGFLIRSFTRPIRQLVEATDVIAEGELGYTVEVESRDELGSLAQSFNRMSADLKQADQARRQMTADIAHDLRTPLSVISGYTEALQDGKLSGSSEMYQVMHQQAAQLNVLIEDLRTLSLLDAGEFDFNPRNLQVGDLIETTAAAFRGSGLEKQTAIQLDIDNDLPAIDLDPVRFRQVLENLISNALKAVPDGGQITLSAEHKTDQIFIEVRDDGPGIPPQDLPHIFDRFYRVDKSRTDSGSSSGLGLAIARKLVEAQGGEIGVSSAVGQGTVFRIVFSVNN